MMRSWAGRKKQCNFCTTPSSSVWLSLHQSVARSSPTDMAIASELIEVELLRFPFLPVQPISAVPCSQPTSPEIETSSKIRTVCFQMHIIAYSIKEMFFPKYYLLMLKMLLINQVNSKNKGNGESTCKVDMSVIKLVRLSKSETYLSL